MPPLRDHLCGDQNVLVLSNHGTHEDGRTETKEEKSTISEAKTSVALLPDACTGGDLLAPMHNQEVAVVNGISITHHLGVSEEEEELDWDVDEGADCGSTPTLAFEKADRRLQSMACTGPSMSSQSGEVVIMIEDMFSGESVFGENGQKASCQMATNEDYDWEMDDPIYDTPETVDIPQCIGSVTSTPDLRCTMVMETCEDEDEAPHCRDEVMSGTIPGEKGVPQSYFLFDVSRI
jgi:hypothetical protein